MYAAAAGMTWNIETNDALNRFPRLKIEEPAKNRRKQGKDLHSNKTTSETLYYTPRAGSSTQQSSTSNNNNNSEQNVSDRLRRSRLDRRDQHCISSQFTSNISLSDETFDGSYSTLGEFDDRYLSYIDSTSVNSSRSGGLRFRERTPKSSFQKTPSCIPVKSSALFSNNQFSSLSHADSDAANGQSPHEIITSIDSRAPLLSSPQEPAKTETSASEEDKVELPNGKGPPLNKCCSNLLQTLHDKRVETRLGKKLYLLEHRTKTHDLAMCWSMAGMVLAILDAEFSIDKTTVESIVLRSGVSITTIISLVFIIRYVFDERKIFKIDNSLQSWHTVLLSKSSVYFLLEIFLLFLHPMPIEIFNYFTTCESTLNPANASTTISPASSPSTLSPTQDKNAASQVKVPLSLTYTSNSSQSSSTPGGGPGGGATCTPYTMNPSTYLTLVIFMVSRLYLPLRSLILHSNYFNSSRVQMLGALNHMNTGTLCAENITYIVRHAMAIRAGTIIWISIIIAWQTFAWILYTSEYYFTLEVCGTPLTDCEDLMQDVKVKNHIDAIYLIPITMMSIGYGDYYPVSYYGKLISVCCGVSGIVCTAVLVAILSKRLTMTRRERYLHRAMIETRFQSEVEHRAACVLQAAWRSFKKGRKKSTLMKLKHKNQMNGKTDGLTLDPEANYLGSNAHGAGQGGDGGDPHNCSSTKRDRAASLISISATPSYERNFLLAVKRFKASRIRLNKVHDGLIEIVDFGIMQQQYMDTLLRVERQNTKIEGQLKTLSMKLRLKEEGEKCLLQQISEINSKLNNIMTNNNTTNN